VSVLRRADGADWDYWFDADGDNELSAGEVLIDADGDLAAGDPGEPVGDAPAILSTTLNVRIAQAPLPPPGGGAWDRNQQAQNAAVAFCRAIARTTTHELGHTLGLTMPTRFVDAYSAAYGGMPVARRNDFRVGSGTVHNGHLAGAIGVHPLYSASVAAGGFPDSNDLGNIPTAAQNYYMDSGTNSTLSERVEPGSSRVRRTATAVPPMPDSEPQTTFTARNQQLLRAILPYQP
jgi:hypothetical protein